MYHQLRGAQVLQVVYCYTSAPVSCDGFGEIGGGCRLALVDDCECFHSATTI